MTTWENPTFLDRRICEPESWGGGGGTFREGEDYVRTNRNPGPIPMLQNTPTDA